MILDILHHMNCLRLGWEALGIRGKVRLTVLLKCLPV